MRMLRVLVVAAALTAFDAGAAAAQSARLSLQSVFGQPAAAFTIAFGAIDSDCVSTPPAGVTCLRAPDDTSTTWYGNVAFSMRLTGVGNRRVRFLGARQAGGTVPPGALLDGPGGGAPTRSFPILPANALVLAASIGAGNTAVTRAIGMRVTPNDAGVAWTTSLVYSLVME